MEPLIDWVCAVALGVNYLFRIRINRGLKCMLLCQLLLNIPETGSLICEYLLQSFIIKSFEKILSKLWPLGLHFLRNYFFRRLAYLRFETAFLLKLLVLLFYLFQPQFIFFTSDVFHKSFVDVFFWNLHLGSCLWVKLKRKLVYLWFVRVCGFVCEDFFGAESSLMKQVLDEVLSFCMFFWDVLRIILLFAWQMSWAFCSRVAQILMHFTEKTYCLIFSDSYLDKNEYLRIEKFRNVILMFQLVNLTINLRKNQNRWLL